MPISRVRYCAIGHCGGAQSRRAIGLDREFHLGLDLRRLSRYALCKTHRLLARNFSLRRLSHSNARAFLVALLRSFEDVLVVGEAKSGREAVTLIERDLPDLALLDWQMP